MTGGYKSVEVRGWALKVADPTARKVTVKVAGTDRGTLTANAYRPDVAAAYPANSANHGFSGSVPSPTGVVPVCPRVQEGSISLALALPHRGRPRSGPRRVPRRGVVGLRHRDGARLGGRRRLRRTVDVHVYVDGAPVGAGTASSPRGDLAGPAARPQPGYSFTVPFGPGGTHEVCTYGISTGGVGANAMLGCRTLTVASSPRGSNDGARGAGGAIDVSGWVLDPDAATSPVHVYVDGVGSAVLGSGSARTDVSSAFPAYSSRRPGWSGTVPASPGAHTVCAYGINAGAGGNVLLGCRGATVPTGSPFGALDQATGSAGGTRGVRGWVIDPDSRAATTLHVYVDGRFVGTGTSGSSRTDVGGAFPGYGDARGYEFSLGNVQGRRVCVYGIDDSGRNGNTTLGCRDL